MLPSAVQKQDNVHVCKSHKTMKESTDGRTKQKSWWQKNRPRNGLKIASTYFSTRLVLLGMFSGMPLHCSIMGSWSPSMTAFSSLEVASVFASVSLSAVQSKNVAMPFLLPRKQPRLCSSAEASTARRLKDAMSRYCPRPSENLNTFCGVEQRNESAMRWGKLTYTNCLHEANHTACDDSLYASIMYTKCQHEANHTTCDNPFYASIMYTNCQHEANHTT